MNWQHFVYFRKVVDTNDFNSAAQSLFITQSALNKAIHQLEEEIGFPLFEKHGRKSVLTVYGEQFYKTVCNTLDNVEESIETIRADYDPERGMIRMKGIYVACSHYLPKLIKQFRTRHPNTRYQLSYALSGDVLHALMNREIDLGFVGDFNYDKPAYRKLSWRLLFEEDVVLAVSSSSPLAYKRTIDFKDLSDEHFIVWKNVDSGMTPVFNHICEKNYLVPQIVYECPDDQTLMSMVAADLGVAVVPHSPSLTNPGVTFLRIANETATRNTHIIWRNDRQLPPAAELFRDFILSTLP